VLRQPRTKRRTRRRHSRVWRISGKARIEQFKLAATPTEFEKSPNVTKDHEDSASPTERAQPQESKRRFTMADGSKVARLAILAGNAVRNVDLHRVLELIEEIRVVGEERVGEMQGSSIRVLR
jgi:hypothetical protein